MREPKGKVLEDINSKNCKPASTFYKIVAVKTKGKGKKEKDVACSPLKNLAFRGKTKSRSTYASHHDLITESFIKMQLACCDREQLRWPNQVEIFRHLRLTDNSYCYTLNLDRDSLFFAARAKCLVRIFKLREKLSLQNETSLLAVHLFDHHLMKNADKFEKLNDVVLEDHITTRNFILHDGKLIRNI